MLSLALCNNGTYLHYVVLPQRLLQKPQMKIHSHPKHNQTCVDGWKIKTYTKGCQISAHQLPTRDPSPQLHHLLSHGCIFRTRGHEVATVNNFLMQSLGCPGWKRDSSTACHMGALCSFSWLSSRRLSHNRELGPYMVTCSVSGDPGWNWCFGREPALKNNGDN